MSLESSKRRSAPSGAPKPERNAAGDHRQAQPLAHRQAEREITEKRVGLARKLGDEAQRAIADQEKRGHLPARARPRREPPQQDEERNALERELVELRRMARQLA